jgi:shikimate dehydrogenase
MIFQILNHDNLMTKFCFLFGKNLEHSPSPKLHNFWFKKYHFDIEYKKCVVQTVHEFVDIVHTYCNNANFIGGNVTMPFKQSVVELCSDIIICSETVKNSASSNTLFRDQNGFLRAENTDVIGIKTTLHTLYTRKDIIETAIVYGGGGAAASCVFTLLKHQFAKKILCLTRDPCLSLHRFCQSTFLKKAIETKHLVFKTLQENFAVCDEYGKCSHKVKTDLLVINTLPLGRTNMYSDPNTDCLEFLNASNPETTFYFDLVYDHTDACQRAKEMGIRYLDGRLMFETQAAMSFKHWTGMDVL